MKIPKIWRMISIIAWIACTVSIGFGLHGVIMGKVTNAMAETYGNIQKELFATQPLVYEFLNCQTNQSVAAKCANDMNSYLDFIALMFCLAGVFSIIAILTNIIDFFIVWHRLKHAK